MTLIEVVAAIAILGTILVGIVLAQARHTRQLARTDRIDAAIEAADRQLQRWWTSEEGVPVGDRGVVDQTSLRWVSRVVQSPTLDEHGARVVRIDFYSGDDQTRGDSAGRPLFSVDLVLRQPQPADETEPNSDDAGDAPAPDRGSSERRAPPAPASTFGHRGAADVKGARS